MGNASSMLDMNSKKSPPAPYEAPNVRELSPEETITILSRFASQGDTEAAEALRQFFAAHPGLAG